MISGYDIICVSTSPWRRPWGSRQQIMSRMCSRNRVLFVEYQYSVLDCLRKPDLFAGLFRRRLRMVDSGLFVYTPLPVLPLRYYSQSINLLNQRLLLWQIRRIAGKAGFSKIILWLFEPTSYYLLNKMNERLSVYHCIDNFRHEKQHAGRFRRIEKMEARLCRGCDVVLASSRALMEDKIKLNPNTFLIPSAADDTFFVAGKPSQAVDVFAHIPPGPRIGVAGTMDHRVDFGLLAFIARVKPDWRIILIGDRRAADAGAAGLERMGNVFFFEWVPNDTLAGYMNSFDVCLIPYKINAFTSGISPIKFYEYMALGKPVVATGLPELSRFGKEGLAAIAASPQGFVTAIEEALRGESPDRKESRISFALNNRWSTRVDDISRILERSMRMES